MTVRELIELNMMITDVEITIRKGGTALLDQLNIGCNEGQKPPYPLMVPKEEKYIGNQSLSTKREAYYIDKSINSWDDGQDYYQVKPNRMPSKWLDLEVFSWSATNGSSYGRRGNFHGQRLSITALPSGESMAVRIAEPKADPIDDDQMTFEDWGIEVMEI